MVIAICNKCGKPCPDAFNDFTEICSCIDWEKRAKKMGWDLVLKKLKLRKKNDMDNCK